MSFEKNKHWIFLCIGFILSIYSFSHQLLEYEKVEKLIDKSITISGPMLGILIALKGILLSNNNKQVIKILKEAGKDKQLNNYLKLAINHTALLLLISSIYIIVNFNDNRSLFYPIITTRFCVSVFWISMLFMTIGSISRFVRLFLVIIDD